MSDLLDLVKRLPTPNATRIVGVLAMLAAWFVVSNTCALGLVGTAAGLTGAAQTMHNCCSPQADGPGEKHDSSGKVCCKSLRMLPLKTGGNLVKVYEAVPLFELWWALTAKAPTAERGEGVANEATGPPELRSFAEAVLQRSLLSHAPPFVA